jgi:hypothetical protein
MSETKKIKKPAKPTRKNIAKDVLALLKAKKLVATSGTYCDIGDTEKSLDEYHDLQELLKEKHVVCDVCALGGMMAGFAYRHDNTPVLSWGYSQKDAVANLLPIFGEEQLVLIEQAFEAHKPVTFVAPYITYGNDPSNEETNEARSFGLRYKNPAARLRAICNNIIDYGKFMPGKKGAKKKAAAK